MSGSELDSVDFGYGAIRVNGTSFSWIVRDQEKQQIAVLIQTTPDNWDAAEADVAQIIAMMDTAGLDPELDNYLVRMNRNPPASVSMSWSGVVNNIDVAQDLFNSFTAEISRLRSIP